MARTGHRFVLCLHGRYPRNYLDFYRHLLTGGRTVAVDGGLELFRLLRQPPDMLVGDMDSVGSLKSSLLARTELLKFRVDKDKTDSQLAIEIAIERGARFIDILMPSPGEADHYLGNILLLTSRRLTARLGHEVNIRIACHRGEFRFLSDTRLQISRGAGSFLSVIPVSARIQLDLQGMRYSASNLSLPRGSSGGLRNEIVAQQASVSVRGEAICYRRYPQAGEDRASIRLSQVASVHS